MLYRHSHVMQSIFTPVVTALLLLIPATAKAQTFTTCPGLNGSSGYLINSGADLAEAASHFETCNTINGTLRFDGLSGVDLQNVGGTFPASFSNLKSISNGLEIVGNNAAPQNVVLNLPNLLGTGAIVMDNVRFFSEVHIDNMTQAPDSLSISSTVGLVSVSIGLSPTAQPEGKSLSFVDIRDNAVLQSVNLAIPAVINGKVVVVSNPALTSVDMSQLLQITGDLDITDNDSLVVLTSVGTVGSEVVTEGGFTSLTSIGGKLSVTDNPKLLFTYFPALTQVTSIVLDRNAAMSRVGDFGSLQSLGNVTVSNNPVIGSKSVDAVFPGFTTLSVIEGDATFVNNGEWQTFAELGLANVGRIGGNTLIRSNAALMALDLFRYVDGAVGGIVLESNPLVESLTALAGITTVQGDLVIFNMSGLDYLDGIENIQSVTGVLDLQNLSLLDCEAAAPLLGWPNSEARVDSFTTGLNAPVECNSKEGVIGAMEGPGQPNLVSSALIQGGLELAFYPQTGDRLFPAVTFDAQCDSGASSNQSTMPAVFTPGELLKLSVSDLAAGGIYDCTVSATNALGLSVASATLQDRPTPPDIVSPPVIRDVSTDGETAVVTFDLADVGDWFGEVRYFAQCGAEEVPTYSTTVEVPVGDADNIQCVVSVDNIYATQSSVAVRVSADVISAANIPLLYIAACKANPQPHCPE